MVSHPDNRLEKIERVNQLREELYELLNIYGIDHSKVLEFSRKLDDLILELLQPKKKHFSSH